MSYGFQLIAFDLDDTLAPSKSSVPRSILRHLSNLLESVPVAVISGGNYQQFKHQLLIPLANFIADDDDGTNPENLDRLHILPTCGTRYYMFKDNEWEALYEENLTVEERNTAAIVLKEEAQRLNFWEPQAWGQIIEDRGSQVTFSALGQKAPIEAKSAWDPDGTKKNSLREAVANRLPHLEVRSGGSTSIDITRKGIDKAYGMQKLSTQTGVPLSDMLFVGDRLDKEGNDYPVLALGVPCHEVSGWEETNFFLEELIRKVRPHSQTIESELAR